MDEAAGSALSRSPAADLPLALARLHWSLPVGARLALRLALDEHSGPAGGDQLARDLLVGAGLAPSSLARDASGVAAEVVRLRSLPDTVAVGMTLLCCGLNPSEVAADAGFGFAGSTNRFWAAALAAGLVAQARRPLDALLLDRVGMTDLAKRATRRASELDPSEYGAGAERVERLVEWLRPGAVCFVGLDGWRAARDRRARSGWQPGGFGGRPAYVMPSTSGLNARTSLAELVAHLRAAMAGPDAG